MSSDHIIFELLIKNMTYIKTSSWDKCCSPEMNDFKTLLGMFYSEHHLGHSHYTKQSMIID